LIVPAERKYRAAYDVARFLANFTIERHDARCRDSTRTSLDRLDRPLQSSTTRALERIGSLSHARAAELQDPSLGRRRRRCYRVSRAELSRRDRRIQSTPSRARCLRDRIQGTAVTNIEIRECHFWRKLSQL